MSDYPLAAVEPIKVIAGVLQSELALADGQIMLTEQEWPIPKNAGLYVALSYVDGQAIGSNNRGVPTDAGMQEVQEVTMRYLIQIDAMSFNSEARTRKEEIIMALRSIAAEKAMSENVMQIARIPGHFLNVGELEATKRLNRFTMTIAVTALLRKVKDLPDYYDKFPTTPTPQPEVRYA